MNTRTASGILILVAMATSSLLAAGLGAGIGLVGDALTKQAEEVLYEVSPNGIPEFRFLPEDVEEEKVAEYAKDFMEPFVRMMDEGVNRKKD